ncbi:hypothetical protein QE435_000313 [Rhizobium sp. SORGH_AS 787]|nr:hypothetical protein [Rhizobium sp. SORGH_AS_0787]
MGLARVMVNMCARSSPLYVALRTRSLSVRLSSISNKRIDRPFLSVILL